MMNEDTPQEHQINNLVTEQEKKKMDRPNENTGVHLQGHIKIWDPSSGEVLVDKRNAIHYENFSEAMALSIANKGYGYAHEMAFGNGGTSVDPTGVITYLPTNTSGSSASLYNQTYYKVIDDNSIYNTDPQKNYMEVRHIPGATYTDIFVSCLLDYGEPADQAAFDNSTNLADAYVFDELGIKGWSETGVEDSGKLLTHVIFHPIQKSLNRLIQIDYTIRVSAITNLSTTL
jgi:hypothetical protein